MRIGELARRAGVSTSRIRFYEARGLLPPAARRTNGYRDYDEGALATMLFVARAQSLGFTLPDIAAHLRSPPDRRARKARLTSRLQAKLTELDREIEAAHARRATIEGLLGDLRVFAAGQSETVPAPSPNGESGRR